MSVKMTRYKQAEFADEDTSSVGSIPLSETASPTMHIRYHTGTSTSAWRARTTLEKTLIIITVLHTIAILILLIVIAFGDGNAKRTRILHVQPQHSYNNLNGNAKSTVAVKNTTIQHNNNNNVYNNINNSNTNTNTNNVCLSEPCIHAASEILYSIDRTIDPCDDFYAFACDQWIRNNPIPDGKSLWGAFTKLEQQNQLVIKNVLEKPIGDYKSLAEQKAKLYYQSCLDEDETIERRGGEPMQQLLYQVGGWSVTASGFNLSAWSLQRTLLTLQNKYNMGGLFAWAVGEDDRNSTRHVIQIDQGGLTLPTRDNYLNRTLHEKVLAAYLDYMTRVTVLLGANETYGRQSMRDVIAFETRLAEITTPTEERRDEELLYHPMTLAELQIKAPFIDWRAHFADALQLVERHVANDERVVVYAPEYLEKLTKVIDEYAATESGKNILNNYLIWQAVRSFTACLSKSFRDAYKGLRKALIGSDGGEEPWRYCVTDTNNVIGFAIGAMFVREVFHGESKPQAEIMINHVRQAFKDNLKNLKWMDGETRRLAIDKADAITDMIGFPDYILNPVQLDDKYKELEIDAKTYFENNIRLNVFNLKRNLEKLDVPVNKTNWGMTPSTVNAYYTPTKNQIVFPAGILQLPFYDINNPKSLNYGAMGVVMGHELTHAFDDQGREYDKYGNLHQWWNNRTIDKFKDQTDCIAKQYEAYEINGRHLNGRQTLGEQITKYKNTIYKIPMNDDLLEKFLSANGVTGENIADNGGLKAAFHAYKLMTNAAATATGPTDTNQRPLPGLNMTHSQLFFLSFAQVWCSSVTDETTNLQIEKDPHSPPKYRVIGPLSNLPEFADVFNCKLGTPMNPAKKCVVW